MHKFSDFADEEQLAGQKIKIADVIDKEIVVKNYRITGSKYSDKTTKKQCLTLQIEIEGKAYVLFTGSTVLIGQCEKYKDEMPFITTIQKIDRFYSFT